MRNKTLAASRLFVMPDEVAQRVPLTALLVNVRHTATQAGLQIGRVMAEEVHDHSPARTSEDGPGIVADLSREVLAADEGQALARGDGEAGEGQDDTRKNVDNDLLVDTRDLAASRGAAAEDDVAAQ